MEHGLGVSHARNIRQLRRDTRVGERGLASRFGSDQDFRFHAGLWGR